MKNYTVLESTIIGFFIGVVVATYSAYALSAYDTLGSLLYGLSWGPLVGLFGVSSSILLFANFIVSVIVFTIYGAIFGLLMKRAGSKVLVSITIVIALILVSVIVEQVGSARRASARNAKEFMEVQVSSQARQSIGKYFGFEAHGDLNGDGLEDVAFLINRDDDERGRLYYLSTAIRTSEGYSGTNLVFLGDGVKPEVINIKDQVISIEYSGEVNVSASSTLSTINAHVVDGKLFLR